MTNLPEARDGYDVIRKTWLSKTPQTNAAFIVAFANVALLIVSTLCWTHPDIEDLLSASGETVFQQHQYWRAFTTMFVHGDIAHLASNSLLFFVLGFFLNGYFGFFIFPVVSLVLGTVANLIVLSTYEPDVRLIGASGIVYAMGGIWLVLYFFLSRQKNTWQRWLRSFGVALLLFAPSQTFQPNVSHGTHLAGFVLGLVFGIVYFYWNRKFFRENEIHEWIVDPPEVTEDDLPGPEGLPPQAGE